MTARDYYDYNELYKAGGLDNFADQYVCFTNDDQPVFFLRYEPDIEETGIAGTLATDTGKCEAVNRPYNPHGERTEP